MIKVNDLIKSVSNMIYDAIKDTEYKCKITDDDEQLQLYLDKGSCFFIDVNTSDSESVNLHFNKKSLVIDIRYFPGNGNKTAKASLYDLKDLMERTFTRSIKVGRRYIHISGIDGLILKDEVGHTLHSSISVSYHEQVYFDKVDEYVMKEINNNISIEVQDKFDLLEEVNIRYGDRLRRRGRKV